MTYKLSIVEKPGYLHAIVTGSNTKKNVARYLEEVLQECIKRQCSTILLEERLKGRRLDEKAVFQIAAEGSNNARGKFEAVAYVDVYANGELMKFAETVAVNRGLPVRVFSTVADAEKWLQEMTADAPYG